MREKRTISKCLNHHAFQYNQGFILGENSKYWGSQLIEFRKKDIKKILVPKFFEIKITL